ncbi:MAG TPA: hypothetical protein VIR16_03325, partial [Candidatus Limnocylindrales bacterium]
VGFVGDEPLRLGLAPECDLVPLPAVGWREALEAQVPDLLLVQSAWQGLGGSWAHRIAWYPHPDAYRLGHLRDLVAWCRERSVPTVFWSTEDPLQVERFVAASALFENVMTVDAASIERLAAEPARSAVRVAHLPHAVQPRLHHPAPLPAGGVPAVFIGAAYRGAPYLQRQAFDRLLDAGARAGLEIRDRKLGGDPRLFGFAERHRPLVGPWLPTAGVPDAIRAHRVLVGNPETAVVPVRVLEALASGRPVVTTPEAAAAAAWPGAVLAGDSDAELDAAFASAIESRGGVPADVERAAIAILESATFRHRLVATARAAGIDVADASPRCGVVALADDAASVSRLMTAADAWRGRVSEIVLGTRDAAIVNERERLVSTAGMPVRVVLQADEPDALRRARLAAVADAEWLLVASPESNVSGTTLAAQLAALPFADAAIVGSPVAGAPSWAPSSAVDPARSIVRRSVLLEHGWPSGDAAPDAMAALARAGLAVYATSAIDEARA